MVVATPADADAVAALVGTEIEMNWFDLSKNMISRRVLITKPELNGKRLMDLNIH